MNAIFIYAISVLYALQGVLYLYKGQPWMGMLTICYAIAGIPLIMMTK